MMLIDLHVHTRLSVASGASPGGTLSHRELLQRAKAAGLDAVCFTERGRPAGLEEAEAASREEGLPAFFGVEIPAVRGRFLFLPENPRDPEFLAASWQPGEGLSAPEELARQLGGKGALIAITPYHREAGRLPMGDRVFLLPEICGIEAVTGHSGEDSTAEELAVEAALARGITVVGGSDLTDDPQVLGKAATLLRFPAKSQAELVAMLRSGDAWSAQIGRNPAPIRHERSEHRGEREGRGEGDGRPPRREHRGDGERRGGDRRGPRGPRR